MTAVVSMGELTHFFASPFAGDDAFDDTGDAKDEEEVDDKVVVGMEKKLAGKEI